MLSMNRSSDDSKSSKVCWTNSKAYHLRSVSDGSLPCRGDYRMPSKTKTIWMRTLAINSLMSCV